MSFAGLLLQFVAWPELSKILLVYGYLSRIPVAIVQFLAMRGAWGNAKDSLYAAFAIGPSLIAIVIFGGCSSVL
jgi:hypothetical protein